MTTVLKLGGSVITVKDRADTLAEGALDRAADAIAAADEDLVLVHGAGSFGHHHAAAHGITRTEGSHDAAAVLDVHDSMKRLDDALLARLHARDVPALPVHPLSAGRRDGEADLDYHTAPVETMLGEGFVPVLHGDVIAHAGKGATIVSGDELVVVLAAALSASRVGLCSGVPGVLDGSGAVIPRIEAFEDVSGGLSGSDATDVTGGMAAKVRALLDLDAPARIFDLDGLESFLAGGSPGTRIG